MAHTDRREPPRWYAKEDTVNRKRWNRDNRLRARRALQRGDDAAASRDQRRTEGWMTY